MHICRKGFCAKCCALVYKTMSGEDGVRTINSNTTDASIIRPMCGAPIYAATPRSTVTKHACDDKCDEWSAVQCESWKAEHKVANPTKGILVSNRNVVNRNAMLPIPTS